MAKIFGLVAEFNPFHNGHKIFIDQIRKKYHPDVLIAVMSGNFVQRGDFAVLDKWQRAKIAVENGIDIVVELPFSGAVQPANIFAEQSVKILHALGVTDIVFGTEETMDFENHAQMILNSQTNFDQDFDKSYAENLNDSLQGIGIDTRQKPNQLLGLNYTLAIMKSSYIMKSHSILRVKSQYSATRVRELLNSEEELSLGKLVPKNSLFALKNNSILTWNDFYPFLRYKVLTNSTNELQLTYQMVEGLNFKVKKETEHTHNFNELLFAIKSKRYTLARIRRLLMYVLMNVNTEEMTSALDNLYLHILSFNEVGQQYLNRIKKNIEVPLITKVGKTENELLNLQLRVDNVRKMIDGKEQNFGVIPYIKGEN
jgi:predicted nucleotidyltransferase